MRGRMASAGRLPLIIKEALMRNLQILALCVPTRAVVFPNASLIQDHYTL